MNIIPPPWLGLDAQTYKRLINRTAVTVTKRARKRGGTYQVKEAMDAIHAAFHRCDGTDPFDGLPLDAQQLETGQYTELRPRRIAETIPCSRCPTISPVNGETKASFEILSLQTKTSKGRMNAEEFIAHCRAVVVHADTGT